MTYDTYWRCVALLSGDVAKLPLSVFQRGPAGKQVDERHPAYRLLRHEASPEIASLLWKRVMAFHAISEGNGYSYISRDGAGRPLELWPLNPIKTYPVRENKKLWYVTEVGAEPRKIPASDVFHLMGLSYDGLVGYKAVAKMREALGLALAADNYGSIYFRNNARPSIVLEHPGKLKPEAKVNLRESWERMHSGLENAHRTAVLEEGMKANPLSINAKDSQLLELKGFSRVQICNFFGVPPHKVGAGSNASYNSLEQENEAYTEDGGGLGYWLSAFAAECWRKLLTEEEKAGESYTVEFQLRNMLRANLTARTQYYATMVQNGILSPNECRDEEGYNHREGGDVYVVPTSPHTAAGAQAKPDGDKPALPAPAPARALLSYRGATDPKRTTAEALQILKGLPDAEVGKISPLMPTAVPPFDLTPADLKDLPVKSVRIAKLIGKHPLLSRARVEHFIKEPDSPGSIRNIGDDLPRDKPYVVRKDGKRYIEDGNHRTTALDLLGAEKIDAYFLDLDKEGKRSAGPFADSPRISLGGRTGSSAPAEAEL